MEIIRNLVLFSEDEKHRYYLQRIWDQKLPLLLVIGLNPSTANLYHNDPTVAKCCRYAEKWGYGGLTMMNIFSYRATNPKDMLVADSPSTAENDYHLYYLSRVHKDILWACGNFGIHMDRFKRVFWFCNQSRNLALEVNKNGMPKHPLYCKEDLKPINFYYKENL